MSKKIFTQALSIACLSLMTSATGALAADAYPARFRVTVKNVTAGNGLSPYLVVVRKQNAAPLFKLGTKASAGISTIAESGDASVLISEVSADPTLLVVKQAAGAPIPAAETRTVEFELSRYSIASASLDIVAMIGKSNDSFIGLNRVSLKPFQTMKGSLQFSATNYDAGSEENSGNVEDFGTGGHPVASAEGHVSIDRGLNSRGNAPDLLGWGSTAATVVIERIQ